MTAAAAALMFTCPRCAYTAPLRDAMRFCPRCGLDGAREAFLDTSPLEISGTGRRTFQVLDRIAFGSISTVYRCRFHSTAGRDVEGLFKLARDARSNGLLANEASVLRFLHCALDGPAFTPFLPTVEDSFAYGDDGGARNAAPPRQANVFRVHDAIRSPADDLYTLAHVRALHPYGIDARDMAWIWRRLLNVLGFVHSRGVVHGAVLPVHVLIEPKDHKLLLVDWTCSVADFSSSRRPLAIVTGGYEPWYDPSVRRGEPPAPGLDIAMGARCMIDLCGGDPTRGRLPTTAVEPALHRYFERCLDAGSSPAASARADAFRLLAEFDKLIDALWGPRKFRVMELPPKR
jgi:hypothetical protein